MSASTLLAILYGINFLLAVAIVFIERHDPSTTWAWLMVLAFIPILGFVLYIFVGQNLTRKRMFELKAEEDAILRKTLLEEELALQNETLTKNETISTYKSLIRMQLRHGASFFTQNNDVEIFTDGIELYNDLFWEIEQAKHHIHMTYYIIRNDALGNKMMKLLTKKASEGVEVRFLYDGMGGIRLPRRFFADLIAASGHVACFFPSLLPYFNLRVNYRNHRKIAVIDGRVAYVGGFNIGDEYIGKSRRFGYWRDTHLRICGNAVDSLQLRFMLDWRYATKEDNTIDARYFPIKELKEGTATQIVSSGPDSQWDHIRNGFLSMISSAKKNIYIQTPYFVPDKSIIEALKLSALSGVDVRIMIPSKPDHPFVYWASYSYVGELLPTGVRFYTYEKGFIHSKAIVVDGKVASVGTTNMDIRSFKLNFEVNAFVYDETVAHKLEHIFHDDIRDCEEITPFRYDQRSSIIKIKESVSRLLSPIL